MKKPTTRSPADTARRVLDTEARAVADLAGRVGEPFDRAVELILSCRGRIVVTGMGKSGIVAQKIAATLSSTGTPSYFMHPAEAVHGDLGMIVSGDVVLALSNSGETYEIVRLLEVIERLGARIIALSGDPASTLARQSDVHLDVAVSKEACGLDLVPTASTTAALAMGDALAVACYEMRGFSSDDFARYHPGGRLGRKLIRVGQLMHRNEQVPMLPREATMLEVVEEITRKRLGMTCVVDERGRLLGVITDGDLRRRMASTERPNEGTAGEAMTESPITIGAVALAAEALHLLEKNRITSLPVTDDAGIVVGVIQIHDLWRTELF